MKRIESYGAQKKPFEKAHTPQKSEIQHHKNGTQKTGKLKKEKNVS